MWRARSAAQAESASCTQSLFFSVSEGKSRFTVGDLRRFARRHGLPEDYASPFFESLVAGQGGSARTPEVDYATFTKQVQAREAALRRVFDALDEDRDGRITEAQLHTGLDHVVVTCPTTRCCYRTRAQARSCARRNRRASRRAAPMTFCDFRKQFLLLPHQDMLREYWYRAGHPNCCDIGLPVQYHEATEPQKKGASAWGHLLAGAIAGGVSRTATAPLETLRIMAMTGSIPRAQPGVTGGVARLLGTASDLVASHGLRALWRGNVANVTRSAPQKALDFFAFDAFKTALAKPTPSTSGTSAALAGQPAAPGAAATLAAAGLAGAASSIILHPLEVVRTRLCVDTRYKHIGHAFVHIWKSEGALALYRGLGPSVAAIVPEAAITYAGYDLLKRSFTKASGREAGVVPSLAAGVCASLAGQTVAYPLETISRRMQLASSAAAASVGPIGVARALVRERGVAALFAGLGPATARVIPMAMISFTTYELVRSQFTRVEQRLEVEAARREAAAAMPTRPLSIRV